MNESQLMNVRLITAAVLFGTVLCYGQTPEFTIDTVAGCGSCFQPNLGDGGPATSGQLSQFWSVAIDQAGSLYIADSSNNRIRKVWPTGIITTIAGNGSSGSLGDGGPAVVAELSFPTGVASDASGNVYISDTNNNRIRKVSVGGTIQTIAGTGTPGFSGDGGLATLAQLNAPGGLAVDAANNVYVADRLNRRIRRISPSGIITTVAGNGPCCASGDGGPAINAYLDGPMAVAFDSVGSLYVADPPANVIRKISAAGTITTVAGNGANGFRGDNGPAVVAELGEPQGVAVDPSGDIFISDWVNNRIRMVGLDGTIITVAGGGSGCPTETNSIGDGCPATSASLYEPEGLAADTSGNVYVADSLNDRARLLKVVAAVPLISNGGVVSASSFGQFTSVAPGSWIEIYGSNLATNARSWTGADFAGSTAPTSLDGTFVTIGGQTAFIDYISPGQVNVQVPSNVKTGPQQLTVTNPAGTSAAYTVTINAAEPGLLAPASFVVGSKQYVAALFPDNVTYVLPPSVPGVTSRRATPGDAITLYGVGFGSVSPNIPAGQIVPQANTLALPLQFFIGQVSATISYDGLAPGAVGLYQFNVIVPNIPSSDLAPVTFSLGGVLGTQALYISVQD